MKAAPFDYERPADIASALVLAARGDLTVKLIAGGQSLGPMLNLRLIAPDLLVDIGGIPELTRVEVEDDALILGACVTHADIEDGRVPDVTQGLLPAVARHIAYRAVRNRGTIGGSLAHADPAADWVSCLAVLSASVRIREADATRDVAVDAFILAAFTTELAPQALIEAIRVPRLSPRARWGYRKACRKPGEFAHAIAAVIIDPERGLCRAVFGATEGRPIVLPDARILFGGRLPDDPARAFDAAAAHRVLDAAGLTDAIDRQIRVAVMRRAVAEAATR